MVLSVLSVLPVLSVLLVRFVQVCETRTICVIDANNNSSFWSDRNETKTRLSPSVTECVGNIPTPASRVVSRVVSRVERNPDKASCVCVLKRLVRKER